MLCISPIVERMIDLALEEDLCAGDYTTSAIFRDEDSSEAYLVAKQDLVLCGGEIFAYVMRRVSTLSLGSRIPVEVKFLRKDGERVQKGEKIATMQGSTSILLRGERIALNLLQHLTGVATHTRRLVDILGENVTLTNTRKTLPGMRELQHYAVQTGGGHSHRFNLGSGILIKDNHIAAAGGIANAIARAKELAPHTLRIEVEVQTLDEVREALENKADIIMLDNMSDDRMTEALTIIEDRALVEISGNVTVENAERLRKFKNVYVSCGALTHSTHAADISMRFGK